METGAFGKEAYILTGYFNIPKILELTLHNGLDPRTGLQLGLQTGDPQTFASFEDLFAAFEKQMLHFIDIKVRGNNVIERLYAAYMPAPFLSLLVDDCIPKGRDYHDGGPRYNSSYIQGVGMGTITDCLSAIKTMSLKRRRMTMGEMLDLLDTDFAGLRARTAVAGQQNAPLRQRRLDAADDLLVRVFEAYLQRRRRTTKYTRRRISHQPAADHLPHLLRLGHRRHPGWAAGLGTLIGGHFPGPGR